MQDMIIELSLYLVIAILLGFTFGWFSAKSMVKEQYDALLEAFKEKYQSEIYKIEKNKEALSHYKKINEELVLDNHSDEYLQELTKMQSFVTSKDEMIKKLTSKLSQSKNELLALQEEHDREMEAFVYERNETLHKYKNLQDQLNDLHGNQKAEDEHRSWIMKMFKSSKEKAY